MALPDAGKQVFHNTRARRAKVARLVWAILFIMYVFALRAFRARPARRAVSQRGNGVFHRFCHLRQNTGFVRQIEDVVF